MNAIVSGGSIMNAVPVPAIAPRPLAESAMLVSLTIKVWSGRKFDRDATEKVTSDAGAVASAARVTKSLVSKAALAPLQTIEGEARRIFYARTLPWLDNGTRVLSNVGHPAFTKSIRDLQGRFEGAKADFLRAFPSHVAAARAENGSLFDETEYPTVDELVSRIVFPRPRIFAIPSASDFRVDIGAEAIQDAQREIAASLDEFMQGAVRDCFERIAETVGAMAEKLANYNGGKAGAFRDSLVENVRELVDVLPSLNLSGDARIADLTERMRNLCGADAKVLRDHADVRAKVQTEAAKIAADVAAFF